MFWRRKNLKVATTLLGLVVIAVAGMVPATSAGPSRDHECAKRPLRCAGSANCCCSKSAKAGPCCCGKNDAPLSPPPVIPNDTRGALKWIPWIGTPADDLVIVRAERTIRFHTCDFLPIFQRSVQVLLCVWRI
jgi:hypothetical protein